MAALVDKNLCLICFGPFLSCRRKYFVLEPSGREGIAFNLICSIFKIDFEWCTANFGTFCCQKCYRKMQIYLRKEKEVHELLKTLSSGQLKR